MSQPRAPRVPADEARDRIVQAAGRLLRERPLATLTVDAVMAESGLSRTAFYRHFDSLGQLALAVLPDADDPLVAQARRALETGGAPAAVEVMVNGLVAVFSEYGPLLRAIDDAVRQDPEYDPYSDPALAEPVAFIAELLAAAPSPPPDPRQSALLLQAAHRAYLLDTFGAKKPRASERQARAALNALWERVLGTS